MSEESFWLKIGISQKLDNMLYALFFAALLRLVSIILYQTAIKLSETGPMPVETELLCNNRVVISLEIRHVML